MQDGPARGFYTVGQAAEILGVDPSTVWRWIETGRLPASRVGARRLRIRPDDLEAVVRPARETAGQSRFPSPGADELARRRALVERIVDRRKRRIIAPWTSADLVREARRREGGSRARPDDRAGA